MGWLAVCTTTCIPTYLPYYAHNVACNYVRYDAKRSNGGARMLAWWDVSFVTLSLGCWMQP